MIPSNPRNQNNAIRILVLSSIEWSDDNAFGNTLSNWFGGAGDVSLYSLYRRDALPNNQACHRYYAISARDILKNWFSGQRIGSVFSSDEALLPKKRDRRGGIERKIINAIHRMHLSIFYAIDDALFRSGKWDNGKFSSFIQECDPHIVLFFIKGSLQSALLFQRIRALSPHSKWVGFIADDVYGAAKDPKSKAFISAQIQCADKVYGASERLCAAYQSLFGTPIQPLYKGCRFTDGAPRPAHERLLFVYAGNLYYGRAATLSRLAEAIALHNKSPGRQISLEIYTASPVGARLKARLHIPGASSVCGARSHAEIKTILADADVVLHVESFEEEQKKIVRYSFSTKMIDCLQSGAALLAIGPPEIASIEYARSIPGAFVVEEASGLFSALEAIVRSDLRRRADETRAFAREKHDLSAVRQKLMADLKRLSGMDDV